MWHVEMSYDMENRSLRVYEGLVIVGKLVVFFYTFELSLAIVLVVVDMELGNV